MSSIAEGLNVAHYGVGLRLYEFDSRFFPLFYDALFLAKGWP